jgi:hypothetical protein
MESKTDFDNKTWEQAYIDSKPLISYSILLGIDMEQVKQIVIDILNNTETKDIQSMPKVLSRMPIKDRHDYEFPLGIQDFVFYEKFKLCNEKQQLDFVPLALTSMDSKRKFAMACKFSENIKHYLLVLKRQLEKKNGVFSHLKQKRRMCSAPISDIRTKEEKTVEDKLIKYLKDNDYDKFKESDFSIFGKQYYIPKAFLIVSEAPYFHEYKEILGTLYLM